jgi:lysophospholipase L1-like esterase
LNVTFTPTDTTNYTTVTSNVSINISKQNTYITWNNPSNITFGTALSNTQLNAVGSVPGTKIYDPAAGTILKVGDNQSLNVTLVPTDSTNYSNSSKSVAINVTKGNVSLVWSKPRNMVYRTALSSTQLNAQAITEGTYTYTPSEGTYLSVGTHTLHVDFVPTDTTNYTNVSKNTTVLVLATNKSAVFTGNSLISGYPGARGWLEPNGSTSRNPVGTISYRFEYLSGIPSYDMGYTAQTTSQILTRFNSSVTAYHPGYCAIEGGVNDVDQGVDNTTILSNIRTEIQYCVDNNTQPLLYLIFPWSGASTAKSNQINYLNSQYKNFTTEFPDLIIVDVRPSVGYNYSGKWMALQSYDAGDNIHFNQAGYYKIGDVTWNALKTARINYPVAKFSFSPVSGRTPLKVRFTDSSTNTPTSWAWDLNNDGITDRTTTYSGQTFTYTYPAAGNYTAKLTVSNNAGSSSFRRTIHVSKRPNHYPW